MITKIGYRYLMNIPRVAFSRLNSDKEPKVICNSFPKSGTFLLFSILKAIPNLRDWGYFIASKHSFAYREKSPGKIVKGIDSIVPRELVPTHIFYSKEVLKALLENNCITFFIYRDPRDVVISEANYLYNMNRFHRLHKYFTKYPDIESRIMFSMLGDKFTEVPFEYLNIRERLEKYMGWIDCENTFSIRYEQLISTGKKAHIRDILSHYVKESGNKVMIERVVKRALKNSAPEKSPTYWKGGKKKWKKYFTKEHKKAFKDIAGDLLIELGYEKDFNW